MADANIIERYRRLILNLLPEGFAWLKEDGSMLDRLSVAVADELARIDERAARLIEEADPRTTVELLFEWERVTGLPDECSPDNQTETERRNQVVQKISSIGGQSPAYLEAVAASLGFSGVEVNETFPFRVGRSRVGQPIYGISWIHWFIVSAPATLSILFRAGQGRVGEPLALYGNEALECTIAKLKPAHTDVLFSFPP